MRKARLSTKCGEGNVTSDGTAATITGARRSQADPGIGISNSFSLEIMMADDPKKTALDRKLISLKEPHEVRS